MSFLRSPRKINYPSGNQLLRQKQRTPSPPTRTRIATDGSGVDTMGVTLTIPWLLPSSAPSQPPGPVGELPELSKLRKNSDKNVGIVRDGEDGIYPVSIISTFFLLTLPELPSGVYMGMPHVKPEPIFGEQFATSLSGISAVISSPVQSCPVALKQFKTPPPLDKFTSILGPVRWHGVSVGTGSVPCPTTTWPSVGIPSAWTVAEADSTRMLAIKRRFSFTVPPELDSLDFYKQSSSTCITNFVYS
jgi:hypothetical protein